MDKEKYIKDINAITDEFIQNCINYRKSKNLTQQELAKLSGLRQQNISRFETGRKMLTVPNLIKYLLGLGLNINKLFDNDKEEIKYE